jgi:hypothetical protein
MNSHSRQCADRIIRSPLTLIAGLAAITLVANLAMARWSGTVPQDLLVRGLLHQVGPLLDIEAVAQP